MKYSHYLLITSLLFLSACGQKGPLYLPEHKDQKANSSIFKNK